MKRLFNMINNLKSHLSAWALVHVPALLVRPKDVAARAPGHYGVRRDAIVV